MTLTVDKTPIDFTLEDGDSLQDVINSISNWLKKDHLIIEKLYINDNDYSQKSFDIDLDSINSIEIETIAFNELNINNISWIIYFFNSLISAIESWNTKVLGQVKKEIPFVLELLPTLLSINNSLKEDIYSNQIEDLLTKYDYFQCDEKSIDKDSVISHFKNIVLLLNERLNEFTNPKEELKTTILLLNSFREDIESISLLLQSGKEDEAAKIMTKFTNVFQKLIRIVTFNINNSEISGDNSINEFTKELNDILSELLEGYESQDVVLIGDILEYELSPRIEELSKMIG